MPCKPATCRCGVVVTLRCFCCGMQDADEGMDMDNSSYSRTLPMQILLLGAAETGKSTVMRQMKIIHGNEKSENFVTGYKKHVIKNVYNCVKQLLSAVKTSDLPWSSAEAKDAAKILSETSIDAWGVVESDEKTAMDLILVPTEHAELITLIWKDTTAKTCWNRANEFKLPDSTEYYLSNIERISGITYKPTPDDILRLRIPTEAVSVYKFKHRGQSYQITDVGGQRGQRTRWIRMFHGIRAVIFVAALSEYDQFWDEDEGGVNRLKLSLDLFKQHLCSPALVGASFILFLNKADIFSNKINHSPLSKYFPRYTGAEDDYEDASNFIQNLFKKELRSVDPGSQLYVHFTTATDTPKFKYIFVAVTDHILWYNMRELFNGND